MGAESHSHQRRKDISSTGKENSSDLDKCLNFHIATFSFLFLPKWCPQFNLRHLLYESGNSTFIVVQLIIDEILGLLFSNLNLEAIGDRSVLQDAHRSFQITYMVWHLSWEFWCLSSCFSFPTLSGDIRISHPTSVSFPRMLKSITYSHLYSCFS
jgi:hypothetical protein